MFFVFRTCCQPFVINTMLCFYLGCCQLALCVKHAVAGCRAGKEGKRNLNVGFTFSKMWIYVSDSKQSEVVFRTNLVAKYCSTKIEGRLQPSQHLRNIKIVSCALMPSFCLKDNLILLNKSFLSYWDAYCLIATHLRENASLVHCKHLCFAVESPEKEMGLTPENP